MQKLLYSPPALIAYSLFLIFFLYIFLPRFNLLLFPYNLIGLVIAGMGLVWMGQARKLFKKHKTTLKLDRSCCLITEGVFSKSRNPIYLGMTVLILGLSIFSTNIIALLIPLAFFELVKWIFVIREEQIMYDTFGKEYLNYKKAVRRWI
jgi:protein-S-isoprenylcysteine O-methyltransferase Ste14